MNSGEYYSSSCGEPQCPHVPVAIQRRLAGHCGLLGSAMKKPESGTVATKALVNVSWKRSPCLTERAAQH